MADRLDGVAGYDIVHQLNEVEHLLFLLAEDVSITALPTLPERFTRCRAYHLTPAAEDRAARMWPAYAVALREAGYTVHLRASVPDTLGDVTVIEADHATTESVLASLDHLPPATLIAIALAGGDAEPVEDGTGALGGPGTLLLRTPWTGADWVSEEVCDHTSLMQLCERWTAARGREAEARLTAWRRRVCGDLVTALDLGEQVDPDVARVTEWGDAVLARPLPYLPRADLRVDGERVALLLSNAGPDVTRAAHVVIDDAGALIRDTVPASPGSRPKELRLPVRVADGRYDVTVTGPNRFRRRYAGPVAGGLSGTMAYTDAAAPPDGSAEPAGGPAGGPSGGPAGGPTAEPALSLTLTNHGPAPVSVTIADRRPGFATVRTLAVGAGGAQTIRHDPWHAGSGWYELVLSTDTGEWTQEYAGHLEAHGRTARAFPEPNE